MIRLITPIVLIAISIATFFVFASPLLDEISALRTKADSYNEALDNSKALESERDKLTTKYNSIDPENLQKIKKLLPDNIDNIRLILEIGQLASPYGMILKNVKYNAAKETSTVSTTTATPGAAPVAAPIQGGVSFQADSQKDYGVWD